MLKLPGVNEILELTGNLTAKVKQFTEREAALNYSLKLKSSNLRQSLRDEIDLIEAKTREEIAVVAEEADAERARIEERLDARKSKLGKAQITARKALLERIQTEEGYRKYEIQKHVIESGRERDLDLKSIEFSFQNNSDRLGGLQKKFGILEAATVKGLRGFAGLAKSLKSELATASKNEEEVSLEKFQRLDDIFESSAPVVKRLRKSFLAQLFGGIPISLAVVLLVVVGGGLMPILDLMKVEVPFDFKMVALVCGGLMVGLLILFFAGRASASRLAEPLIEGLGEARSLRRNLGKHIQTTYEHDTEAATRRFNQARADFEADLKETSAEAGALRASRPEEIEEKAIRIAERIESAKATALAAIDERLSVRMQEIRSRSEAEINLLTGDTDSTGTKFTEEHARQWDSLEREWKESIPELIEMAKRAESVAEREFLPWSEDFVQTWRTPAEFRHTAKFGSIAFDLMEAVEGEVPSDPRLVLPPETSFNLPLSLSFPESGSILFETKNSGNEQAIDSLNNLILRIFTGAPAGRVQFTIIDPVGLGQHFAGIMHLADHEDFLISSRIWTQPNQIEEQLSHLNDHMEKVIQMYLRNEYATITEYNEKAGNIAEKYHFIVVADFPHSFTEQSAQRLLSIASTGARCGVYSLIHWDSRAQMPLGFSADDLRNSSVTLKANLDGFFIPGNPVSSSKLSLDEPPREQLAIDLVNRIGQANKDSNRIQVPFSHIAPSKDEFWSHDTTEELRVPVGRTGATKLQYLAIGKGTCQHALIAGKTGSGKSTLFHVMITNLALWCDPDHVEFYLIDFKKGVEFKCYADANLPHARVIAIESDREFGLSVLQRLDEELKRRGEMFRKAGVQDVAGYKRSGGKEPIPRTLLLIDEFQEFFVEDDQISQNAALLLDRIVRQGRAFGIHAILGSQTLGGAFTLARATLGQMVIRIALQCNEADAYLIMDDSNPAPRMLTRPGEGIYNDSAGAIEGNSPFQVVWLGDEERDEWLEKATAGAANFENRHPAPVVFEGNAPANVQENAVLKQLRSSTPRARPAAAQLFLGSPNSIKGPTEILLQRQSGNNVLIVGQRDEAVLSIMTIGLLGLYHQYPVGEARFVMIDGSPAGAMEAEYLDRVLPMISHVIERPEPAEIGNAINSLAAEMNRRLEDSDATVSAPPVFIFINGLQKFKKLRYEEDFSFSMSDEEVEAKPGTSLNDLITEAASVGIHLIVSIDTFNNVNRAMSRKALSEFEMRVLFQMSANDSASLIDSVKASGLGMNRALFYNEQAGYLETFRPYSLPPESWFANQEHSRENREVARID